MRFFNTFFAAKEKPPVCLHEDAYPHHIRRSDYTKDGAEGDILFACKTCGAGRDVNGWVSRDDWCLMPPRLFSDYAISEGVKECLDNIKRLQQETDAAVKELSDAKRDLAKARKAKKKVDDAITSGLLIVKDLVDKVHDQKSQIKSDAAALAESNKHRALSLIDWESRRLDAVLVLEGLKSQIEAEKARGIEEIQSIKDGIRAAAASRP